MRRFDARGAVITELKELGLFVETKENAMVIPICAYVHSITVLHTIDKA
jgi:valyl-tRNA synthetase